METDIGDAILPLYDKAKHKIYDSYIQLQRQAVLSEEKKQGRTARRIRRIEYNKRYNKYYFNVIAIPEYKRLHSSIRKLFEFYHKYGNELYYEYEHIRRATTVCAVVVESLNITRITNLNRKNAF